MEDARPPKLVIVGDSNVGKTCLIVVYTTGIFPRKYVPTLFDNYSYSATFDGGDLIVALWDTAGGEEYDRLRPLSYPDTSVFLLCFSVSEPASFANVETRWVPEVSHHCPGVPVVLVATKVDLRDDQETIEKLQEKGQAPISFEQGIEMKEKVGAAEYFECSSLTQEGVQEVFLGTFRTVLKCTSKRSKRRCILL